MDAPPVQFVTSADGWRIAYTVFGEGQPLVVWSGGFDSAHYTARHHPEWLAALASSFRVIYADMRGSGLSQRGLSEDLSLADYERDVEAVADRFPDQPLIFLARVTLGHAIVRFAVKHPERVRAIIWWQAIMTGGEEWSLAHFAAISRENYNIMLDSVASSHASGAQRRELAQEYARNFDLEDMRIATRAFTPSNVEAELATLTVPLLVIHPRDLVRLPPTSSMRVAACAPNARFVLLECGAAFDLQEVAAIDDFLASLTPDKPDQLRKAKDLRLLEKSDVTFDARANRSADAATPATRLTPREAEVLRLIAEGRTNKHISTELVLSERTVARHITNIYAKIGIQNRAQAALYARDHGLA